MLLAWLALITSATSEPTKVVVLGVRSFDQSTQGRAAELEQLTLTELTKAGGLQLVGQSDLMTMLSAERQRQLLGCADDTSCMTEITSALGAPYLIEGTVGRVGTQLRVDLKLVQVDGSRVIHRGGEVLQDERDWYAVVTRMLRALSSAIPRAPVSAGAVLPWVLAGLGAGAGVTGGLLMFFGASDATTALASRTSPGVLVSDVSTRYDQAAVVHRAGLITLIAGSLITVSGLLWAWLGHDVGVKVSFIPLPGMPMLTAAWSTP